MRLKKVLDVINVVPGDEDLQMLKSAAKYFVERLREALKKEKISAEVFLGGSFAKGTLVKKEKYDIDVFVRFDWRYDDITSLLARAVKRASKGEWEVKRLHGSRDYFHVIHSNRLVFEVVPVAKIKKPNEAKNVTDLSYFHVSYVLSKIKDKKIAREIALTKTFCRAQRVYGAESYIRGFSGYGLECLIIYYGSFEKMAKALAKAKERIVIDPAKHYRNKDEILMSLNESRLTGPIILVDPTWKERNVLAALGRDSFTKLQESLRSFLKKPDVSFFIPFPIDIVQMRGEAIKNESGLLHVKISTDRQPGDIAGTKLKKVADFIGGELRKAFKLYREEFEYNGEQGANAFYIVSSKKEVIKTGPPLEMKKHSEAFKKANKKVYIKDGRLYAKIRVETSSNKFMVNWIKDNKKKLDEMEVRDIKVD